jgi:hypothetical protein
MLISISSENTEYIEKLKAKGFVQIQNRVRSKGFLLFTDVEVNPFILVVKDQLPFMKKMPYYQNNIKEICPHCGKDFHYRWLQEHIKLKHLK